MALARGKLAWRDVKGHRVHRQSKGGDEGLETTGKHKELVGRGDQLAQLGHRAPVDPRDPFVHRVAYRQHGVAVDPVEIRALVGAGGPLIRAPVAGPAGAFILPGLTEGRPPVGFPVLKVLPGRKRQSGVAGLGHSGRRGGKFALVLVVHRHRLPQDRDRLRTRHPGEGVVCDQLVVDLERRQVVPVGVAVALGKHLLRIGCVDHTVGGGTLLLLHVVIDRIDRFPGGDSVDVVPVQPVVSGGRLRGRGHIIPSPPERQGFIQDGGDLSLERKPRGSHRLAAVFTVDFQRWVGDVIRRLVAYQQIEIVQITGGKKQGVVHGGRGHAGVDALGLHPVEHCFVNFDEAKIIDA